MNVLDIGIILIFIIFGWISYKRGFIMSCFSFLPMAAALIITYIIHPVVSKFLRTTPIYFSLREKIGQSFQLEIGETTQTRVEFINSIQLPDFLKSSLIENDNSVVHNFLNADKIQDYVSSYIANVCINVVSMVILFIVLYVCAKLLLRTLNIVFQLPVLNFFNKFAGLMIGIVQSLFIIWIAGIALTFFYHNADFQPIFNMVWESKIARVFYENNILLAMILKVFQ